MMLPRPAGSRPYAAGFTLIELLTSVSIALLLSVMATVAFIQVRGLLQRMHIRLEMHNSARFVYQNCSEAVSSLQQDGALWVETTKNDGSGDGIVAMTFLKGKADAHGFTTNQGDMVGGEEYSVYQNRCCDLAWSSWRWNQKSRILYTGTNKPPHQFKIITPWASSNGDYGDSTISFLYMPQPLRQATPYPAALPTGSSQAALSGSRYGSPDVLNDLGDYQDLQNQMSPAVRNITSCVIELILNDGTVVDADVNQTRTLPFDGSFVDARATPDTNGAFAYKKRPRLIRLLLDMQDPQTGVSQTFSFSFQPPGLLPATYPTGNAIP